MGIRPVKYSEWYHYIQKNPAVPRGEVWSLSLQPLARPVPGARCTGRWQVYPMNTVDIPPYPTINPFKSNSILIYTIIDLETEKRESQVYVYFPKTTVGRSTCWNRSVHIGVGPSGRELGSFVDDFLAIGQYKKINMTCVQAI